MTTDLNSNRYYYALLKGNKVVAVTTWYGLRTTNLGAKWMAKIEASTFPIRYQQYSFETFSDESEDTAKSIVRRKVSHNFIIPTEESAEHKTKNITEAEYDRHYKALQPKTKK